MLQLWVFILPSVFLIGLLLVGLGLFLAYRQDWEWLDSIGGTFAIVFGAIIAAITLIFGLIGFFPYQGKYYVIAQHSGTISSISNRFVDASGDLSDGVYVVKLDGDKTPYVVDDARVLAVKTGDKVDLACTLGYVYGGADQTSCYIASY